MAILIKSITRMKLLDLKGGKLHLFIVKNSIAVASIIALGLYVIRRAMEQVLISYL